MTSWSKGNQMHKKLTEIAEIIDLLKHHMKNFQARNIGFSQKTPSQKGRGKSSRRNTKSYCIKTNKCVSHTQFTENLSKGEETSLSACEDPYTYKILLEIISGKFRSIIQLSDRSDFSGGKGHDIGIIAVSRETLRTSPKYIHHSKIG